MNNTLSETYEIKNSDKYIHISIGDIIHSENFVNIFVTIFIDNDKICEKKIVSIGEISAIVTSLQYIGNFLRNLEKKEDFIIDFHGFRTSEYFVLPKDQRIVWEE